MNAKTAIAVLIVLLAGTAGSGGLCRYTVRDIGFVDLTGPQYTLYVGTPLEPGSVLDDTNIRVEIVEPGATSAPPGHGRVTAENAVLAGPHGSMVVTPGALDHVVSSPAREALLDSTLDRFAAVLVIESGRAEADAAAYAAAVAAVERLAELEPTLPRPIDVMPEIVRMESTQRRDELFLLWSLGVTAYPAAAVVYGRGKLAGPALAGDAVTADGILDQLALVGQSCECETDRDWVNEPAIPHRWDRERRDRAALQLGFDPESPMVKAEVTRIIDHGPLTARRELAVGRGDAASDLIGYSEIPLDEREARSEEDSEERERSREREAGSERGDATSPGPLLVAFVAFTAAGLLAAAVILLRRGVR